MATAPSTGRSSGCCWSRSWSPPASGRSCSFRTAGARWDRPRATMVKALEWLGNGDRAKAKVYLFLTALGGAIFVSLQAYEWSHLIHRGLHINGNPWGAALFGTSFFIVTGFHGLHVTGGVIYLVAMIGVVSRRPDPAASYNMVEITGLYWHFVDLVWIMVFTFMYLL